MEQFAAPPSSEPKDGIKQAWEAPQLAVGAVDACTLAPIKSGANSDGAQGS